MSPAQLCKIERGRNGLTASTLRRIADALEVSVSALLGERSEASSAEDSGEWRAAHAESALYVPVFVAGEGDFQILAEIEKYEHAALELEDRLGIVSQTAIQLVYAYGCDERAAELLARDIRTSLGMGRLPCIDLAAVLEDAGVHVVRMRRPSVFQSASFYNKTRRSIVVALNSSNTKERDNYRLAYELGGAVLFASRGFKSIVDDGSNHRFLRAFAAAFLMPEEAMRGAVARLGVKPDGWSMPVLVYVKERFGVSAESFALRLENLGLVVPSLRHRLRDELHTRYDSQPRAMEPHPPKNQTCVSIMKAIESKQLIRK
jgi:Zn-dependent peptidase ImmA (M78 family)